MTRRSHFLLLCMTFYVNAVPHRLAAHVVLIVVPCLHAVQCTANNSTRKQISPIGIFCQIKSKNLLTIAHLAYHSSRACQGTCASTSVPTRNAVCVYRGYPFVDVGSMSKLSAIMLVNNRFMFQLVSSPCYWSCVSFSHIPVKANNSVWGELWIFSGWRVSSNASRTPRFDSKSNERLLGRCSKFRWHQRGKRSRLCSRVTKVVLFFIAF